LHFAFGTDNAVRHAYLLLLLPLPPPPPLLLLCFAMSSQ
jgi:hypothetical protein